MIDIVFTELNFAGYERKHKLRVDEWRATKNQNGTYNVICTVKGNKLIFNGCTYPEFLKKK